jgi:hypothetical protein
MFLSMLKIRDRNYSFLLAKFEFGKQFFKRVKRGSDPLIPDTSLPPIKLILSQFGRRNSIGEEFLEGESRIGREIDDILGLFSLLLFYHVVL